MPFPLRTLLAASVTLHTAWADAGLSLSHTFTRLTEDKKLKVVVVGNSVTAGAPAGKNPGGVPSFYVTLEKWLRANFPDAQIEVVPKIIYAIGPEVQLFRMDERMLAEKPDLVVAEFGAANGAWGDSGKRVTEPATEGFLRRLRAKAPTTDAILVLGIFKTMLEDYRAGKTPASVTFLRDAAKRYDYALADPQKVIAERVLAGEPWEAFMKDFIHPGDAGYQIYGTAVVAEFARQWAAFQKLSPEDRTISDHPLPAQTLHPDPWINPRLVPAIETQEQTGFTITEKGRWKILSATQPDAIGRFVPAAPGKVVGVLMRNSGKAGNLEIEHDGKWFRLSQKSEPHFTDGEDKSVKMHRNFFGVYGLPLKMDEVKFRVSPDPEVVGNTDVELIGFFVIDSTL